MALFIFNFIICYLINIIAILNPKKIIKKQKNNIQHTKETIFFIDDFRSTLASGVNIISAIALLASEQAEEIKTVIQLGLMRQKSGLPFIKAFYFPISSREEHPIYSVIREVCICYESGCLLDENLGFLRDKMELSIHNLVEQKAMEIPIKMIFPIVFFILPTLFILLSASAIRDFFSAMENF